MQNILALAAVAAAVALSGCNQSAQQADVVAAAPVVQTGAPPAQGGAEMQALAPIYTPLVDMHRRSPQKFARDHAECRALAEPQERAARQALATRQTGAALQVAGAMASFIPVGNFRQAVNVANASSIATEVGAGAAEAGAQGQAEATADYALVVDNCLSRRGYRLLREG